MSGGGTSTISGTCRRRQYSGGRIPPGGRNPRAAPGRTLWTPEYAVLETERILLTPRIQRRFGKLSAEQVKLALAATTSSIQVLPETAYRSNLPEAKAFSPDPADTPYFALALHLETPIWSNDALLKEQDRVTVYTTQEVLDRI
ncbi:MAG: hypothetical protein HYZ73_03100 [Elusimicrobia bacterium]|nr:hypothetical protein [Elusimicrobiota bacterium]